MNKIILISLVFFKLNYLAQTNESQSPLIRKCASPKVNPTYEEAFQEILKKHERFASSKSAATVYNIPVIFHIIHSGEAAGTGANISQAQITSQLSILNAAFRKTNSDLTTYVTQPSFLNYAADVEINFCAAKVDPSGVNLLEPGIDRIEVSTKGWAILPYTVSYIESTIKPGSSWNPNKYFNVWVLSFGGADASTLGYAQFPTVSGSVGSVADMAGLGGAANTDGVVIGYSYFGATPFGAPYNKGKTLVHETGHWLGLWHIWGDDGVACTGSDFVTDTPNQADENYTCPSSNGAVSADACAGSSGAMYQNYMDYSDDKCLVMFTLGQKIRMQAVMANCVRRASLNSSNVCTAVGIQENAYDVQMNIWPNPTNDELSIEVSLIEVQDYMISIVNTLGQSIKEDEVIQSNIGKLRVNLSGVNPGLYFVVLKSKSGSVVKRFVLE
jgi:Pregnancy-associated plasma protein-A/Secretion system C-terminal sorting domain